ncbi:ferredoxin--NADP reductase [Prescottella equi]|jgi:3-ketosteroid 9alpha-monooxygenase subunit B|uniref:3-ketosteroid-9-alpha-monooxygenase, ferredoxin reductase component n=2 Tax=Rhodococcus hoagii TaxID=43767 RepID=E9T482_RHOHA|nr:ferredoxin--NADP reductase [Prescottella equi]MCD7052521.1 ferredoxin--NADP reductase [Rhodococcus sp. BH2-1]AVP69799.1 3-ketosteroid-9-alpha-hydroxylase [Prescottella equi]EGD23049.1 2Fe-2S iron-sulfur cluster binding domain protein [Prescottella equi ATCC 33707]ERN44526.1 ferredoxin domain oxidoreductase [Prescottella equi NBRC 101255 = C 7]MBM4590860.1 2Fe-2S iron-sulfur cluster binding domain-containing protein [Prescottella equi]
MTTIDVPHSSRSAVLTVSGVIEETPDSRSLVFDVPADMKSKFQYKPGQFLTLRIPSDQTGSVARCYSLASSPFTDDAPKVTVKRTADGYGSNWLCDNLKVGDQLEVLPPAGVFTPKSLDHDFLLFGGGSGITPVMSILKSALTQGGGKVVLLYGNRDVESVIFAAELRELAAKYPDRLTIIHWIETVQGLPSVTQLATLVSPYTSYEAFMCGPGPFMDTIHEALAQAGMPRSQVHAEVFNSLSGDPFADVELEEVTAEEAADAATVEIELDGEKHNLSWPRKQTLVDVMLSKGLDVPYSCQEGECGSCACTVIEGEVSMEHAGVLDEEDIANGYILGCQAKPVTDHLKIEF